MKTLLFLLALILLASCARYTHKYTFAVEYTNGDRDTVSCVTQMQKTGFYSGVGSAPCLVVYNEGYSLNLETVACYVRKYSIIEHTITRKP